MPGPIPRRAAMAMAMMLALAALAGCEKDEDRNLSRVVVDFAKVPPTVIEAAKKQWPGVNFTDAWTNHEPGKTAIHSYEVRGKDTQTGKSREVRVGPDGKVLEFE